MAPISEAHHHRSTVKTPNKSFKSRHATKSLLKDLSKGMVGAFGWLRFLIATR